MIRPEGICSMTGQRSNSVTQRFPRSVGLAVLVLGSIYPGAATAQNAEPAPAGADSSEGVTDIVVTANRLRERLQDAPLAVSALSAEALRTRGLGEIQDLKGYIPNLEINPGRADGAGASASIYIRGVGQNDFLFPNDPGVGLYVDGVYLARSVGANLDLSDIERIEVLRGPQGTLYGKNTIGGAINVVTQMPDLRRTLGSFELTVGSYNRLDAKAFFSIPLIEDRLALKLSAASLRRDGFMIRDDGVDLGDQNVQAIRGALRFVPAEGWDVLAQADYSTKDENGAPGALVNVVPSEQVIADPSTTLGFDPTPSNPTDLIDLFNGVAAPSANASLGLAADSRFDGRWITDSRFRSNGTGYVNNDSEVWGGSITIEGSLGDEVTFKSITAYRDTNAQFGRDGDHSPYTIVQTQNAQTQDQFSQEGTLTLSALENRLSVILGGYYMIEHAADDNFVQLISPITDITRGTTNLDWRPYATIRTTTWAGFGQATFEATPKLSFVLGGRYSYDKKRLYQRFVFNNYTYTDPFGNVTDCYTCLADGTTGRTLEEGWGAFTPKAGVNFKPNEDVLLYASYARGFKSGGWSPRPTPTNRAEEPFDPETIETFELGAKTQFFDRRMTFNLAAFLSYYKDIQLTTLQPNFSLQVINAGENRLGGLEAELVARPVRGLDLNASVGWLSNTYTDIPTTDPNFQITDELPDAPEWTLNLGGQYRFDLTPQASLTLRGDANYRSKTWKELYNLTRDSVVQFYNGTTVTTPVDSANGYVVTQRELATPAYWVANFRATLDLEDGLGVTAFVTNAFDETYFTTLLPVTAFGYDEGYYGRPREWGMALSYRF